MSRRVERLTKTCEKCERTFVVGGKSGPRKKRFCSKRCAMIGKQRYLGHMSLHCAPTLHPTTLDIAWAAGIYEGEGTCQRTTTEKVQVGQKNHWLCARLRALFGGWVFEYKSGPNLGHQRWVLTGPRARGFLLTIFTFLSPHRQKQVMVTLRGIPYASAP